MIIIKPFFFLFFAFIFSATSVAESCDHWLGTFNAHKLIHDKRFLPDENSEKHKLDITSQLIAALNNGKGPDLLAMVEVDGQFLQELVDHPGMKGFNLLTHGVAPQSDDRGNNVGLISRFPLVAEPKPHIYWDENDPVWSYRKGFGRKPFEAGLLTRAIMEYRVALPNGEELVVFVNHWPSKKMGDWAALQRMQAATYLKNLTDLMLDENPDANIFVVGDLNTNPYGPEIRVGLRMNLKENRRLVHLEHLHFDLKAKIKEFKKNNPEAKSKEVNYYSKQLLKTRGSYYYWHDDDWELFDQIIVSKHLLKYLVKDSYGTVINRQFMDGSIPIPYDPRRGAFGASDHLPVGASFNFNP